MALPTPGEVIDGVVEVIEEIGRGPRGVVFRAFDRSAERDLALKVITAANGNDPRALTRFRRDTLELRSISHPHIAQVYHAGTTARGLPYVTSELLEGFTLDVLLRHHGPLNHSLVRRVTLEGLAALDEAHRRGLVHDSLRPTNIFLVNDGGSGHVKVLDFATGAFEPTPLDHAHRAPEVVNRLDGTAASDLYALGVSMAEMLTGRLTDDATVVFADEVRASPFSEVVLRAASDDPARRYPSARAMGDDLGGLPQYAESEVGLRSPVVGDVFEGKYRLEALLGRGGFATVFRARDLGVGRDVALKVLTPDRRGYEPSRVARFFREAKILAGLRDPHTITLFDFGRTDDGLLFMAFEFVDGCDLKQFIRTRGPQSEQTVRHILVQVLQALREAHGAGILHRDLKPHNILVYDYMGDPFRAKLLDFGIAKPRTANANFGTITRTGAIVGTPRYMSPEQILGDELVPSSDLYSLGLIAYEMLVGHPFSSGQDTEERVVALLRRDAIALPSSVEASVEMRRILAKMTARDEPNRFQTADECLRALGGPEIGARRTGRMTTRPPTVVEGATVVPTSSRRPGAGVVVVAVCVGALVAVLLAIWTSRADDRPAAHLPPAPAEVPVMSSGAGVLPVEEEPPAIRVRIDASQIEPVDVGVPAVAVDLGADSRVDTGADLAAAGGCGNPAPFEGTQLITDSGPLEARWMAYAPRNYDENRRYPVMVLLHASMEDAANFLRDSGFTELADEHGFVIVAPYSRTKYPAWRDPSDDRRVMRALSETNELLCLDPTKVYAVANASGGEVLETLICMHPFAAIATASHRTAHHRCDVPFVPYIAFMGDADPYFALEGGRSCTGAPIEPHAQFLDAWKSANACTGKPRRTQRWDTGQCESWKCRSAAFESCIYEGGHPWPGTGYGGLELPMCRSTSPDFPIAEKIWDFFVAEGIDRSNNPVDLRGR